MNINKTWVITTDKRVKEIFNEVVKNATEIGYLKGNVYGPYTIRPSTKCYGQCKYNIRENCSAIGINKRVIDSNDESAIRSVIVHEVAHSCALGDHHGYKWEHVGNNIGRKYGIRVSRLNNYENVESWAEANPVKYIVKCPACGAEWKYHKCCNAVKHPEIYQCECGHLGLKMEYNN